MIQDFYYLWLTFLLSFFPQLAQFYFSRYRQRKPTLETLYRIAVALDVKMSDIVAEIENRIE